MMNKSEYSIMNDEKIRITEYNLFNGLVPSGKFME